MNYSAEDVGGRERKGKILPSGGFIAVGLESPLAT
jgi:hypothetical protein